MITLTVDTAAVEKMLRDAADKLADFSAPIAALLEERLAAARESIGVTKSADGVPWAPMAPATIRGGRDPSTLLVKTERLLDSLQRGAAENIFEAGPGSGRAGTSVPHAAPQQDGTMKHPQRPPRPFLFWSERDADAYLASFEQHLEK